MAVLSILRQARMLTAIPSTPSSLPSASDKSTGRRQVHPTSPLITASSPTPAHARRAGTSTTLRSRRDMARTAHGLHRLAEIAVTTTTAVATIASLPPPHRPEAGSGWTGAAASGAAAADHLLRRPPRRTRGRGQAVAIRRCRRGCAHRRAPEARVARTVLTAAAADGGWAAIRATSVATRSSGAAVDPAGETTGARQCIANLPMVRLLTRYCGRDSMQRRHTHPNPRYHTHANDCPPQHHQRT